MKNYQECDYFYRQTYELLTPTSFNLGISTIVLLVPAISNRICHAKLAKQRKCLNLSRDVTAAFTGRIQPVFAFGIALFASEQ